MTRSQASFDINMVKEASFILSISILFLSMLLGLFKNVDGIFEVSNTGAATFLESPSNLAFYHVLISVNDFVTHRYNSKPIGRT